MAKIKNTLLSIFAFLGLALTLVTPLAPAAVQADHCGDDQVQVSVEIDGEHCVARGGSAEDNAIVVYLRWIVRFLAGGVGLVVTFMIVVGGFQYITSSGNPEGLQHAKKRLTESIEALLLFVFMSAILNYVIPGGIL